MNVTKPMREVSVDEILQQFNLVVPEIQREYVWGLNQYGVFETFLEDVKVGCQMDAEMPDEIRSLKEAINNKFIDEKTKRNLEAVLAGMQKPGPSMNIGFLYSYRPSYYIGNDREEDLYLIDGQQRFTTLILLLFYFALKENRKTEFLQLLKFDYAIEKIAFDYRVRSITHQFFIELFNSSDTISDLLYVADKQWFLEKFRNDVTVMSVVGKNENFGVFKFIDRHFANESNQYFDFVSKGIKFWHFKTEETSQGEELYITMNSRGQQLAENETIRAKLFDSDTVKKEPLKWSERWEIWQDFFWKHRNKGKKGITADEGFNEFLRWIQIMSMWERLFKDKLPTVGSVVAFEKVLQWEKGLKLDIEYLNLTNIEFGFRALQYLYERFGVNQDQFEKRYKRSHINNLLPAEWIATTGNPINLIHLFQLLPVLYYCKSCFERGIEIDDLNLYRFIRSLRTLSKDKTIGKAVLDQIANVLYFSSKLQPNQDLLEIRQHADISRTILNEELVAKLDLIATASDRDLLEDLIWFAEDIRLNNGEVLHLIRCTESMSPDSKKFDISIFGKVVATFAEFIKNRDLINGHILHTDCYFEIYDRVELQGLWYKKEGLMNLIKLRIAESEKELGKFLIDQEKNFIKQYSSSAEMIMEKDAKKQLYIYYITIKNDVLLLSLNWNWDGCYNFGKLKLTPPFQILFESGNVFQHFRNNFTVNNNRILEIHNFSLTHVFPKLLGWAKS